MSHVNGNLILPKSHSHSNPNTQNETTGPVNLSLDTLRSYTLQGTNKAITTDPHKMNIIEVISERYRRFDLKPVMNYIYTGAAT
jgi:hypothetical protein